MKVTTTLSEELIHEVRSYGKGKSIADSLTIALNEWVALQHIIELNRRVQKNPLQFRHTAEKIRAANRHT